MPPKLKNKTVDLNNVSVAQPWLLPFLQPYSAQPKSNPFITVKDPRKVSPTTMKPINPNRDLLTGQYDKRVIEDIAQSALQYGLDPNTTLAIAMQETQLGKTDANYGHVLHGDEFGGADALAKALKASLEKADRLGYKDKNLRLQVYNGLGTVYPQTEQRYHGYKMDAIYGVPLPPQGINMKQNPLYGKRINSIRDSVIMLSPEIQGIINNLREKTPQMYYQSGGSVEDQQEMFLKLLEGLGITEDTIFDTFQNGGIPTRYKNMGFTRVGQKKTGDGKHKWKVLAKKGDKYKVVQGGWRGMQDYTQHRSEKRRKNFWSRMGGKNSSKATDPFSPLYWHKRFGTW